MADDWYERRDELEQGQVFRTRWGDVVKLDHRVPGDGTQWQVEDFHNGSWLCDEGSIEPGDLETRLPDEYSGGPEAVSTLLPGLKP